MLALDSVSLWAMTFRIEVSGMSVNVRSRPRLRPAGAAAGSSTVAAAAVGVAKERSTSLWGEADN